MKRLFAIITLLTCILCSQVKAEEAHIWHLNKQTGLSSNHVTALEQDHHGYIWVGTDKGLNRVDGHEIFNWDSPKHPLHDLPIRGLETDKKNNCLWIFGPKGLAGCILFENNQFISHTPEKGDSLFMYHHKGKLYTWQYGHGARCNRIRLNKEEFETTYFPHEVVAIRTDEEGNDWLLTKRGLYLNGFEEKLPSSEDVKHITTYLNLCVALTPNEIIIYNHSRRIARRTSIPEKYHIKQCTDIAAWGEQLLIFTSERTLVYHILDETFTTPSNVQLKEGRIFSHDDEHLYVYEDKGKFLRFGNDNTIQSWQLKQVETTDQEASRLPLHIVWDTHTEAFAIHGNGLYLRDLTTGKVTHYRKGDANDFIRDNHIDALLADHTGCLWIGTHLSGLTCLIPNIHTEETDSLTTLQTTPRPHITYITIDGENSLISANKMTLPYTHNNVEWHFSCLDYARTDETTYQYYLAEHDSTWQVSTYNHKATYKNLQPGLYTFHVKASLDGQHWGSEETHTIVICEPWWTQWPAMLAILALFGVMGLVLYLIMYHMVRPNMAMASKEETSTPISTNADITTQEEVVVVAQDETPAPPALTAKDQRFKELLDNLLAEHIEDADFTVEAFAACVNLKRTQFYTKVKQVTGITPIELLRKAHMEHAAKLLRDTDMNIDDVRIRCGFSNSTTFYNYFKQHFGQTPRQYRQNCLVK